jgi:hypothetical protein
MSRRTRLAVEALEDRRLCSVSVPTTVDLHATVILGRPFTVKVLSNDSFGRILVQAPSVSVEVDSTGKVSRSITLGTPLSVSHPDLNNDGTPDLVLTFSGRDLRGLVAGPAQVTVRGSLPDGTSAFSFITFTLTGSAQGGAVNAGHKHRPHPRHHKATTHSTPSTAGTSPTTGGTGSGLMY